MNWQPIDTCPEDVWVMVAVESGYVTHKYSVTQAKRDGANWRDDHGDWLSDRYGDGAVVAWKPYDPPTGLVRCEATLGPVVCTHHRGHSGDHENENFVWRKKS